MNPTERIAVIDCGTNTFHLLIGESGLGQFRFLHRGKRVVKIGSKPDPFSPIPEEALAKAYSVLDSFRSRLKQYQVSRVICIGTAALRDSINGKTFLAQVRRELGFDIRLIPGDLEAALIYGGVRNAIRMDERCSLIMDIGGGSTEFILCNASRILWKKSYRLGAARLLAWWSPADPPNTTDSTRLEALLATELADLIQICKSHPPELLIGASGSFETLAALAYRGQGMPIPRRNEVAIPVDSYRQIHHSLISSTHAQRVKFPGMLRMRAEMIIPASHLISFVLNISGIKIMKLSRFALKEGIFFDSLNSVRSSSDLTPKPFLS